MVDDGDQQHTVVDHANQAKQNDATDHEMNKDAAVSTMANDNDNWHDWGGWGEWTWGGSGLLIFIGINGLWLQLLLQLKHTESPATDATIHELTINVRHSLKCKISISDGEKPGHVSVIFVVFPVPRQTNLRCPGNPRRLGRKRWVSSRGRAPVSAENRGATDWLAQYKAVKIGARFGELESCCYFSLCSFLRAPKIKQNQVQDLSKQGLLRYCKNVWLIVNIFIK